ncbi:MULTISPECIES: HDOD domain-containing protein [Alteromonadaceae]|uniref:HDOD domain-containing protein n=1 Tax=Alteromonadaceae TaxID=72275 RepID=UPI001C099696|nr:MULTISPECIES: HDOD domain-containing protein [Aliiglaciecola]MBU2877261.1 HDOD domain-containing protein [Aliiglaciecola lipolytica]MDO6712038.1 HDOD domain-containing protein [Aliiglaciecola sp. 2_MG-2023]MDO6753598.1 HDOD domain-containing protein [Aliiglaciecola sp. 1_MG-2023]
MSTENALLTILVEKIKNDTIVLPTLPAIALKVRRAADDPKINLNSMGDIIAQDPSLSARIIKISNSAYLGRTIKVTSVSQAVTRIGLSQIKNISTALAMEQLFVSKNELVKSYIAQMWDQTIESLSYAVAALQFYSKSKKRHLSLDTLTLASLIHNIGVLPILTEAERHEEVFANPKFLDAAIIKLSGHIGGKIMRQWDFDEQFVKIAEKWRDMSYQEEEASFIDFVRLGAALSGVFDSQKDAVLKICLDKKIIEDVSLLESPEFIEARTSAKAVFA